MSRGRIAVDIDDVLAGSTDALRVLVNQRKGVDLTLEDYRIPGDYRGYYEFVWERNGISKGLSMDDFHTEMIRDQSHIMPIEQAVAGVQRLGQRYELVALTSRDPALKPGTQDWLTEHCEAIFNEVFYVGVGSDIPKTKGDICREQRIDWLIDDNIDHCKSALDNNIGAVLFGQYGWHQNVPANLAHCKNWQEVMEYFSV